MSAVRPSCFLCEETYSNEKERREHYNKEHARLLSVKKNGWCYICDEAFAEFIEFPDHFISVHDHALQMALRIEIDLPEREKYRAAISVAFLDSKCEIPEVYRMEMYIEEVGFYLEQAAIMMAEEKEEEEKEEEEQRPSSSQEPSSPTLTEAFLDDVENSELEPSTSRGICVKKEVLEDFGEIEKCSRKRKITETSGRDDAKKKLDRGEMDSAQNHPLFDGFDITRWNPLMASHAVEPYADHLRKSVIAYGSQNHNLVDMSYRGTSTKTSDSGVGSDWTLQSGETSSAARKDEQESSAYTEEENIQRFTEFLASMTAAKMDELSRQHLGSDGPVLQIANETKAAASWPYLGLGSIGMGATINGCNFPQNAPNYQTVPDELSQLSAHSLTSIQLALLQKSFAQFDVQQWTKSKRIARAEELRMRARCEAPYGFNFNSPPHLVDKEYMQGVSSNDECPRCDVKKVSSRERRCHYRKYHYPVFYNIFDMKMSNSERWMAEQLGSYVKTSNEGRLCQHCGGSDLTMYQRRRHLLLHIKEVHESVLEEMKKDYAIHVQNGPITDMSLHDILME